MVVVKGMKRKKTGEQVEEKDDDQSKNFPPLPPAAAAAPLLHRHPQLYQQSFDWWDDFSKSFNESLSKSKDSATFESFFNISRKTFTYICTLVKTDMMAKHPNTTDLYGKPLCLEHRVAIALRRLSSGELLSSVGDSLCTTRSAIGHITWSFVESMEETAAHHLQWPSTETEMSKIKSKFEQIRGLPNCCGAIETTHIKLVLFSTDKSNHVWYDEMENYSMLLQTVVDPDMRFIDIVTGYPGSLSDSVVLQNSGFYKLCKKGQRLNGDTIKLQGKTELGEYLVGDLGFPLLPWLFTPYPGTNLSASQASFNTRHLATRMVAQRALAQLKATWKMLEVSRRKPDLDKLPRIIFVCCLLHNIAIDLDDEVQNAVPFARDHDPEYKQQVCDYIDKKGYAMRKKLTLTLWKAATIVVVYKYVLYFC